MNNELSLASSSFFNSSFEFQVRVIGNMNFLVTQENNLFFWGLHHQYSTFVSYEKPTLLSLTSKEKLGILNAEEYYLTCLIEHKFSYSNLVDLRTNSNGYLSPTLLSLPTNERIFFIDGNINFIICLTQNRLCYVWGRNNCGQLGLGDKTNRYTPTLLTLPNNENISHVACGLGHTICLTDNALCYVWGSNFYAQLGLGDFTNRSIPTLLTHLSNQQVSFIACGSNSAICLTNNNLCYVWGNNYFGQLGLGDKNNCDTPTLLTLPNNEKISFITCGNKHTICLTEKNQIYVWGENNYGELGLGDTINRSIPTILTLPNNEKISHVACGNNHTICVTENNQIYVWGMNNYGQLGLGDRIIRFKPTLLK